MLWKNSKQSSETPSSNSEIKENSGFLHMVPEELVPKDLRSGLCCNISNILEFFHKLIGQFELKLQQMVGAAMETTNSDIGNWGSFHRDKNCYRKWKLLRVQAV